jgi:hypothetical protein
MVSLLLCLLGASLALAQPVGPEFRVNTYTTSRQTLPAVASDSSGNFVVVWESGHYGGGVFGQRYDSSGAPLGPEFRVNTYMTDSQDDPVVASDSSGNFVVVWESDSQDGSSRGVFGQRYDSSGAPLGPEFRVNTYTTDSQSSPVVASDSSGNFVVVWTSYTQDGWAFGVFGQRYDSSGAPLGPEFRVNTYTTDSQDDPVVASDSSGNFVVVWQSDSPDGSHEGVFGQRYDSSGAPLGPEFRVNTYTTHFQYWSPAVASDSSGNFVVVWRSCCQDGSISNSGVFGQRYDSTGAPLGPEFRVNTFTMNSQYRPAVTSNPSGNFVVVWASCCQDGSSMGVFGQRYDSSGAPLGPEFRVNTYTTDRQTHPAVTSNASGNFVVAWASYSQDGSSGGVFGQRFSAACEASVQVRGEVHTPGSTLPIRIHIAHNRPETVTVPWELSLIDPWGQVVAERVTPPHTFEPGDVVDVELALPLPEHLEEGTYTLRLGISGMAGTEGATTNFRVAEPKPTTSARPL